MVLKLYLAKVDMEVDTDGKWMTFKLFLLTNMICL